MSPLEQKIFYRTIRVTTGFLFLVAAVSGVIITINIGSNYKSVLHIKCNNEKLYDVDPLTSAYIVEKLCGATENELENGSFDNSTILPRTNREIIKGWLVGTGIGTSTFLIGFIFIFGLKRTILYIAYGSKGNSIP